MAWCYTVARQSSTRARQSAARSSVFDDGAVIHCSLVGFEWYALDGQESGVVDGLESGVRWRGGGGALDRQQSGGVFNGEGVLDRQESGGFLDGVVLYCLLVSLRRGRGNPLLVRRFWECSADKSLEVCSMARVLTVCSSVFDDGAVIRCSLVGLR